MQCIYLALLGSAANRGHLHPTLVFSSHSWQLCLVTLGKAPEALNIRLTLPAARRA